MAELEGGLPVDHEQPAPRPTPALPLLRLEAQPRLGVRDAEPLRLTTLDHHEGTVNGLGGSAPPLKDATPYPHRRDGASGSDGPSPAAPPTRERAGHGTPARAVRRDIRHRKDNYPDRYPLAVWPELGGFLPFANSYDADHLGWLTAGPDPDAWPLIVWSRHADQEPAPEGGLIDTLLAWQRGTLATEGLAALDEEDDPVEHDGFEAWDDSAYW
ncbi:hypothetical protein AB0I69_17000 [Streptomyces sp. NPDC050508]|uniref:hypothetical protein n=1 Tax=Streptomyces sp. NPDC050508 TaxID=3155405 RepID=UPI003440C040